MESKPEYKFDALPDMNQRGAFSLYCDDVRPEASGKMTIVGTYGPVMYVNDFPAVLPTFFIISTAWTSRSRPFEKLIFRVLLDESVLSEQALDVREAQAKLFIVPGTESFVCDSSARQLVQRVARFSPFILEKECMLRVRIETEDGELRTSGLAIRRAVTQGEGAEGANAVGTAPGEDTEDVGN